MIWSCNLCSAMSESMGDCPQGCTVLWTSLDEYKWYLKGIVRTTTVGSGGRYRKTLLVAPFYDG